MLVLNVRWINYFQSVEFQNNVIWDALDEFPHYILPIKKQKMLIIILKYVQNAPKVCIGPFSELNYEMITKVWFPFFLLDERYSTNVTVYICYRRSWHYSELYGEFPASTISIPKSHNRLKMWGIHHRATVSMKRRTVTHFQFLWRWVSKYWWLNFNYSKLKWFIRISCICFEHELEISANLKNWNKQW